MSLSWMHQKLVQYSRLLGFLLLVPCLLAFGWHHQQQQLELDIALAAQPKVNDFYFIDYFAFDDSSHPRYRYTVMKAVAADNESVTLVLGNVFKTRKVSVREHLKGDRALLEGFFSKTQITLNHQTLNELIQQRTIYAVRRPQNLSIDGWLVVKQQAPRKYVYKVNEDNQQGINYYRGENGYIQDFELAVEAFRRAAQADDASGQINLAQMYRDGVGTHSDPEQALYWFKQAALQGRRDALEQYQQLCDSFERCQI